MKHVDDEKDKEGNREDEVAIPQRGQEQAHRKAAEEEVDVKPTCGRKKKSASATKTRKKKKERTKAKRQKTRKPSRKGPGRRTTPRG